MYLYLIDQTSLYLSRDTVTVVHMLQPKDHLLIQQKISGECFGNITLRLL